MLHCSHASGFYLLGPAAIIASFCDSFQELSPTPFQLQKLLLSSHQGSLLPNATHWRCRYTLQPKECQYVES